MVLIMALTTAQTMVLINGTDYGTDYGTGYDTGYGDGTLYN